MKTFSGYLRVVGNHPQFQPCGTAQPVDMFGIPPAMRRLTERIRFTGIWEGKKAFAQLQGGMVTDTVTADAGTDSAKPGPRLRFYLVALDSFRVWKSTDCGGMRVS